MTRRHRIIFGFFVLCSLLSLSLDSHAFDIFDEKAFKDPATKKEFFGISLPSLLESTAGKIKAVVMPPTLIAALTAVRAATATRGARRVSTGSAAIIA